MDVIDMLENNRIIVTENEYKLELLKEFSSSSKFISVKFMNKKEFLSKFYFSYDEKAIYYLMDKYNIKEDIAVTYLNNLIYIKDKTYNNQKLDNLSKIKEELINNNLLIYDDLFRKYLKNKTIYFYKYNYFTKLEKNMIEELQKDNKVKIVEKTYTKTHQQYMHLILS